jgi:hypothetical protein
MGTWHDGGGIVKYFSEELPKDGFGYPFD